MYPMHNHNEEQDAKRGVLNAIQSGKASMRPKWYFVLKGALFLTGILIALAGVLYLASFAVFAMRETGAWSAPSFGIRGLIPFFRALPATLITLSLVFIVLLETLVRRYSFAYRAPLLYSLLAILAVVMAASPFIAPLHRRPFQAARAGHLPFGGQFYRSFGGGRVKNARHGIIESFVQNGFVLRDTDNATSLVIISPETRVPNAAHFEIDEPIAVFGDEDGAVIKARGIRKTDF